MIEVRTEAWTCDSCGARTRAYARHDCPKPMIGSFDLSEVASEYAHYEVAGALDEALAEHERDSRTDVWLSFWDRLTDGDCVPARAN